MTVMADSDITVAVATHKAYRMPIDGVYMPLQVGRALHPNVDLGMTCDNTGDNISQLNAQYSELTGLYWMWKNCDADYQGLVHYRRHFAKNDSAKRHGDENERFSCIAGKQDYARLLDTCEIIVPERRNYYIETVYSHYEHTMQEGQLDATRSIIAQTNSDYLDAFDAFDAQMNKTSAHLFNMFVMRKDLINEYCSWMFPIIGELAKHIDSSSYSVFEMRFPGRISEILFDVWLETNHYPYVEMPIISPEPVDWIKKGSGFLMAKFVGKKYVKSC